MQTGSREDETMRSVSTFTLELRKKLGTSQAAQVMTKISNLSFWLYSIPTNKQTNKPSAFHNLSGSLLSEALSKNDF